MLTTTSRWVSNYSIPFVGKRMKEEPGEAQVLTKKKERITIMKTMLKEIKKVMKAFIANYKNAMSIYGEAICKGRGCACA